MLDRFHVVKLLNQGLDTLRRRLRREAPQEAGYQGLKWLLFKRYHRLRDDELDALYAAFSENAEWKAAYFLREQFHHILDRPQTVASAVRYLDAWVASVQAQHLTLFDTFIGTLQCHKEHITNYVLDQVSNAVTEGLNNLVRSIRRCAFGMPNFQHLRLRVMASSGEQ